MKMIEAKDVHFTYPNGVQALKGSSLTIKNGEFVAIMGENGAGKTTLVKHFNGLLKPTKGTITIDNVRTSEVTVATLSKKVGFVFQNPDHQLFSETVEEEIAFALKNFGFEDETIERRVTWALNLLDLEEYRETSPFMLSGGERKRVALASVLAWNPKILILDEPTIGQDHQQKEKLLQFILQMKEQEKTVIIVTHDVEFVAECDPRVVLMHRGRIVADGEAEKVLTSPEILIQSSIVPPQITQIFLQLSNHQLPREVIDIYEAQEVLLKVMEGKRYERF
ncbi:MAG: ABC transporter ATP-binding protein [Candidatus Bathyarchaeota archaeon]|jgi:energy-coupling factor transport system ATP-binding protein